MTEKHFKQTNTNGVGASSSLTTNEQRLFELINEDPNPQEALMIATKVLCDFLENLEQK